MAKRKHSFFKSLLNVISAVPSFFSLANNAIALLEYEAQTAGRSIIKIILLLLMTISLLTVCWWCLLGMLFLFLTAHQLDSQLALFIILLINLFILIIVGLMLSNAKKNIFFPHTRRLIKNLRRNNDEY